MQTAEFSLYSYRGKGLTLVNFSHTDLQQTYRMSWLVPVLIRVAPRCHNKVSMSNEMVQDK